MLLRGRQKPNRGLLYRAGNLIFCYHYHEALFHSKNTLDLGFQEKVILLVLLLLFLYERVDALFFYS